MRDLDFISGLFFEYEIPKDKHYLTRYFRGPLQLAFLRYYMVFGSHANFTDHTGVHCSRRLLYGFERRYKALIAAHEKAKKTLSEESMEALQLIESGKYRLTRSRLS